MTDSRIDLQAAEKLEREYDPEMRFRGMLNPAAWLVTGMLVVLSGFHYYTAGFGILTEHWHKGIHLGFVLGLIFLVFGATGRITEAAPRSRWWKPGNVPLYDWFFFFAAIFCSLYLPVTLESLTFRIGNPNLLDVVVGTTMIFLALEATRRAMGLVLPIIVLVFILYALFGQYAPGVLTHPGTSWRGFISHVYMTTEGIYGIPVKVVSTFVFHFVLFGVIATRMGLGQFFIDVAQCIAGRYAGGAAKVAVLSSAMFGTISGSSIANTVTTGSLTIPAMKRIGYPAHFAGAVEAAASTGGQITPPIMGAAAFVMMEFLDVSYLTVITAAIIPAAMHFLAVFTIVHLEARKLGLKGTPPEDIPRIWPVIRRGWPTVIPLILVITIIMQGYTPFMAAFWGITACIVVGFLNPMHRMTVRDLIDAFQLGAKYALAVGAAAAVVGIIVGVVTVTGTPFRISFMVTQAALGTAETVMSLFSVLPFELFTQQGLTLFFSLIFVAVCCVALGAGIPTTALYIIVATIAAPVLVQFGIPPLAAHMFVLFYGVLADITPPVCTSAYAAGGIAGANPFRTGMTAFRLGNGKALVPLVFVYSPSLLLVLPGFTWTEFLIAFSGCTVGIVLLGAALTGYLLRPMSAWQCWLLGVAALLLIAPNLTSSLVGLALVLPVLAAQLLAKPAAGQARAP
ncbi:MAG: TRAP transporter permease, partial [Proteobacteria bacterium]|nr:TRAP transporter permease [Pseudomonadota bacterium]